jgi:hypothetical protein
MHPTSRQAEGTRKRDASLRLNDPIDLATTFCSLLLSQPPLSSTHAPAARCSLEPGGCTRKVLEDLLIWRSGSGEGGGGGGRGADCPLPGEDGLKDHHDRTLLIAKEGVSQPE